MIRPIGLALSLAAAAPLAAQGFTPDAFRAHVAFLADDLLEGRDIGSRGHEIAAAYVAQRFAALGLKPGGDNGGWLQQVPFQRTSRADDPGSVTVTGPRGTTTWRHGTSAMVGLNPQRLDASVSGGLVFVGYGLVAPSLGIDDYRGLDVTGKIVVALSGVPKGMPSEEGAHLSSEQGVEAAKHGAIGLISIATIQDDKAQPWDHILRYAATPRVSWIGRDGKPYMKSPGLRATAGLDSGVVETLFAGAPRSFAAIRAEADKAGARPKGFALRTAATIVTHAKAERITSPNVVAILPGTDKAGEYVSLSAHLDHIGIRAGRPGDTPGTDRINNGALDNAAGVATMLEVARAAVESGAKHRRSLLFVATTGEEKGLLGADYFARNPTVPQGSIVANVDLDMPLLLYRFTDVIAFGADHSTLGRIVAAAAAPMGVKLAPDPMPEEGIFTRSDHYMFVRQGVPAVMLATGYADGGAAAWGRFFKDAYHQPGDDMAQKIDWTAGARFAELNYRITAALADAAEPPRWYKGDFFGDLFAPKAAKAAR